MKLNATRLEKPLLLTSTVGICVCVVEAFGGNILIAAGAIGVTFMLLGRMLDEAIAAQSA
jgi:hypothetical protein